MFPLNLDPPVARSLSIQFILQALIDGFALVAKLEASKQEMTAVFKELENIFFFSSENCTKGIWERLYFYSEILMDASQVKNLGLAAVLEEMRRSALLTKSKMVVWKKMSGSYPLDEMLEQLMQLYFALFRHLCHFFDALVPFLKEARSDENVLMYLIEKKGELNRFLGQGYIEEVLRSFFPTGFDQLSAVIYEGYTRRGFNAFFSKMEKMIGELEWDVACQSQSPL